MTTQSKLAVILHADVVDSTKLVQKDELLAHERIQAAFRRFAQSVQIYGGKVTELRGDAFLAEFARASDAVLAALSAQEANACANGQLDDDLRPLLRVGVALGEVVYADDTVTGAGVVLAQRLEQFAQPGGVCVSAAIREAVPVRLPFDYEDLDFQEAKGFDQPVQAFAIRPQDGHPIPPPVSSSLSKYQIGRSPRHWVIGVVGALAIVVAVIAGWKKIWKRDIEPADRASMAYSLPDKPSIAVLPFENLSGDKDQEFLSDGVTENITTALSRVSNLFVIPRTTTRTYKDKAMTVAQVAEELGVRYVLEGSVQRSEDQVRVTTQLIDALKGRHVWTDRFDRELKDTFSLLDEVTKNVLTELSVKLSSGESSRLLIGGTKSLKAYQLVGKGMEINGRLTKESIREARELFLEAIQLDPNYVAAWSMLGWGHLITANRGWTEEPEQEYAKALEMAQKASAIDPSSEQPYALLAAISAKERRYEEAIAYAEKAFTLAPNSAAAVSQLARVLSFAGRPEEAIAPIQSFKRYSPITPTVVLRWEGVVYHTLEQYQESIKVFESVRTRNPKDSFSRAWLAIVYSDIGQMESALTAANEVVELAPKFSAKGFANAVMSYKDRTIAERNLATMLKVGLPE